MVSSTVARPTMVPTLNRREAILLYPLLSLCDKQGIKKFTTRQITCVVMGFVKRLRTNKASFAKEMTPPVASSLRKMIEECQRCQIIEKRVREYVIQRGFIRIGFAHLNTILSAEDMRELDQYANELCRAYLKA